MENAKSSPTTSSPTTVVVVVVSHSCFNWYFDCGLILLFVAPEEFTDDIQSNYGKREEFTDDIQSNYGKREEFTDDIQSNYGKREEFTDDIQSNYGRCKSSHRTHTLFRRAHLSPLIP